MRKTIVVLITLVLTGCITTTTHYGKRPDLSALRTGMTEPQVRELLGKPAKVFSEGGDTYLMYGWDSPWDGRVGATEEYYIRLVDGKVDSYGEEKPTLNINSTVKSAQKDLYTELTKLKSLLDSGAITQAEYDAQKRKLLED